MAWPFSNFFGQAMERSSRSSVIATLLLLDGIVGTALLVCVVSHGSNWLEIYLAILFGLGFVAVLAAYAYFARNNIDALRSESFYLQKMAIEYRVGDALTGFLPPPRDEPKSLKDDQP